MIPVLTDPGARISVAAVVKKAAFFGGDKIAQVYAADRRERIAGLTDLYPDVVSGDNLDRHLPQLGDLQVIFSTWGFPDLSEEALSQMPSLEIVLYAAGTVKSFARPLLERGIIVEGARTAIAMKVAQFTSAQVLLACKGYFRIVREFSQPGGQSVYGRIQPGPGYFAETVAVLGLGAVGSRVVGQLTGCEMTILAVDPTRTPEEAERLGVSLVGLEEAFRRAHVVTCHLPNLESLRHVIAEEHFRSMRENATFINTGRGAQVDHDALIRVMKDRPDLTALLDVTDPEPMPEGSEIYALPNVLLSTHFAGSTGNERLSLADFVIEEFIRWQDGGSLADPIRIEELETMA